MKKLLVVSGFFLALCVVQSLEEPPVVNDEPSFTAEQVLHQAVMPAISATGCVLTVRDLEVEVLYADVGTDSTPDYTINYNAAFEPVFQDPFSHIDPGNQVKDTGEIA